MTSVYFMDQDNVREYAAICKDELMDINGSDLQFVQVNLYKGKNIIIVCGYIERHAVFYGTHL